MDYACGHGNQIHIDAVCTLRVQRRRRTHLLIKIGSELIRFRVVVTFLWAIYP